MSFFNVLFTNLLFYIIYYDQNYLLFDSKFYVDFCYANVMLEINGDIYNWPVLSFRCYLES